jgi:peptidyl-prolyl cis-trans isomerase SurA
MQAMDINEISDVFKTVHGYHFIEVTGRRVEDFSERFRMGQAENYLRNQKFDEELDNWQREIRDKAFVEIKN